MTKHNESEILNELLFAVQGSKGSYFPITANTDKVYNFFLDLEKANCCVANSRIHVFADAENWAIVFESNGYDIGGLDAIVTLHYFGNCIEYQIQKLAKYSIVSNTKTISVIDFMEFDRMREKNDNADEDELIDKDCKEITIRDTVVPFSNDRAEFEKIGGVLRKFRNPKKLLRFCDAVRLCNETYPELMHATDEEIRSCLTQKEIPLLITIEDFHYTSLYSKGFIPANHETYNLLAKVITNNDASQWKPTLPPNNHWKNWTSGNL